MRRAVKSTPQNYKKEAISTSSVLSKYAYYSFSCPRTGKRIHISYHRFGSIDTDFFTYILIYLYLIYNLEEQSKDKCTFPYARASGCAK